MNLCVTTVSPLKPVAVLATLLLTSLGCAGDEPSPFTSTTSVAAPTTSVTSATTSGTTGATAGSTTSTASPTTGLTAGTTGGGQPTTGGGASTTSVATGTTTGGVASTTSSTGETTGAMGDGGTPAEDGGTTGPVAGGGECLQGIGNLTEEGPFSYKDETSGSVKMWVPDVPAGCKVPVVHLSNGTTANCGNYINTLRRLASHGFLSTCYESTDTGSGVEGMMALETVYAEHSDMADTRIGSTGHSQGGQASFVVLQLAEEKYGSEYVYAGLAMQPASGFGDQPEGQSWQDSYAKIRSPMFMFSGTSDVLVSENWVKQAFDALDPGIEAYWWSANGSTHIPTPDDETAVLSVPWFRWKLLGDNDACIAFKGLKGTTQWTWEEKAVQNEVQCQ